MSKLTLELNDDDIKVKLDELIGKRVAALTDQYLSGRIASIVDTKLERVNIDQVLADAARKVFVDNMGDPDSRYSSKYSDLLRGVAVQIIEKRLKDHGISP